MEQIDSDYDRRFQESLAENRDVLIIAPTPTLTYNLDSTQTTYNPKLYSGGTYNIAFRIGKSITLFTISYFPYRLQIPRGFPIPNSVPH